MEPTPSNPCGCILTSPGFRVNVAVACAVAVAAAITAAAAAAAAERFEPCDLAGSPVPPPSKVGPPCWLGYAELGGTAGPLWRGAWLCPAVVCEKRFALGGAHWELPSACGLVV